MDFAMLVPISMFFAIVLAIKVVVDARWRKRLVETNPSEETLKSIRAADKVPRHLAALKWGLVLTLIGGAFGVIEVGNLASDSPGAWGILFAASGVGLLAYHFIANRKN